LTFAGGCAAWQAVNDAIDERSNTWVFCDNVPRVLAETGFWELVEAGEVTLSLPHRFESDALGRMSKFDPQNHCFVFGKGVTIVSCRFKNGNRFTLLDFANLDRSPRDQGKPAYRRVDEMERFILDLVELCQEIGGGNLRYTIAGLAYSIYRSHLPDEPIYSHDLEPARKLERESYFGGQLSHYYLGLFAGDVYHVDVRSMFPFIMKSITVPTKLLDYWENVNRHPSEVKTDYSSLIAKVEIDDPDETWPVRVDGKPYYCRGSFTTTLAGPELASAVDSGVCVRILSYARYRRSNIFSEFVERLWGLRGRFDRDGDQRKSQLIKLLMNSVYGKFAQMSSELVPCTDFWGEQQWGSWVISASDKQPRREFLCLNWQPFEVVGRAELPTSIPAISSFITSAVRIYMRKLRQIAGQENCLYQATDALVVNKLGLANLETAGMIQPNQLGKLKIKEHCTSAAIYSHNFYRLGDELVCSGLTKEAVRIGDTMFAQVIQPTMKSAAFLGPHQRYMEKIVYLFSETSAQLIRGSQGRRVDPPFYGDAVDDYFLSRRQNH